MPDSFELPWMRSAVVKLMRGERFAGFFRRVIDKLIALTHRHSVRSGRGLAGRSSRLEPRLAAVIGALNDLSEPAAGLRRVKPVRIDVRTFHVIDLPATKVRTTDVPFFTLSIRCQDECTFAGAYEYSYIAHLFVPLLT